VTEREAELLEDVAREVQALRELAAKQVELLAAILQIQQRIEQEIIRGFL
jgi:hypothetical protein